jgi:hypothetical protein
MSSRTTQATGHHFTESEAKHIEVLATKYANRAEEVIIAHATEARDHDPPIRLAAYEGDRMRYQAAVSKFKLIDAAPIDEPENNESSALTKKGVERHFDGLSGGVARMFFQGMVKKHLPSASATQTG